ncbi:MFS transporter [Streptomyces sp. ME03-5709C]|nr:MFS transporter [Streptomyces sp. ME03-5709C]
MNGPTLTRYRRQLSAAATVVAFVDFVFGATFVVVMSGRGIPGSVIGALLAASQVVATVIEAPSGAWGDRYGQRRIATVGLACWAGGLVLFGLTGAVAGYAAALTLWTVGMAAYSGAPTALFIGLLSPEEKEANLAGVLRGLQIVRWLASGAGALAVAVVGNFTAPRMLILAGGVLLAGLTVWTRYGWPESPLSSELPVGSALRTGVRLLLRGELLGVLLLTCVATASLGLVIFTWQPMAFTYFSGGPTVLGLVLLVLTCFAALGSWASKRLPERWALPWALATLMLLQIVLAATGHGVAFAVVGFPVAEFLVGVAMTLVFVRAHQIYPDHLRNTLSSLVGTAAGLAMAAVDLIAGRLWEDLGIRVAAERASLGLLGVTVVVAAFEALRASFARAADPIQLNSTVGEES